MLSELVSSFLCTPLPSLWLLDWLTDSNKVDRRVKGIVFLLFQCKMGKYLMGRDLQQRAELTSRQALGDPHGKWLLQTFSLTSPQNVRQIWNIFLKITENRPSCPGSLLSMELSLFSLSLHTADILLYGPGKSAWRLRLYCVVAIQ